MKGIVFALCIISTIVSLAVTYSDVRSACNYNPNQSSSPMCLGRCPVRNSKCDIIQNDDMLYCDCIYCNYNPSKRKCVGECKNRLFDKCIKKIRVPKRDSDCGCASCRTTTRADGSGVVCSGSCFNSGLKCKPKDFIGFQGKYQHCVCL